MTEEDVRSIPTPECDRLRDVAPFSQKIGEFLDWCRETKGWELAEDAEDEVDALDPIGFQTLFNAHPHEWGRTPVQYNTTRLLAEFFDIDLNKVEEERRAILAALQRT